MQNQVQFIEAKLSQISSEFLEKKRVSEDSEAADEIKERIDYAIEKLKVKYKAKLKKVTEEFKVIE